MKQVKILIMLCIRYDNKTGLTKELSSFVLDIKKYLKNAFRYHCNFAMKGKPKVQERNNIRVSVVIHIGREAASKPKQSYLGF